MIAPPLMIVQARMGSTRLPGKVLRPLAGQPMLLWQLDRLLQVQIEGAQLVVGGTTGPLERPLELLCQQHGYTYVAPPCEPADVLGRFAAIADAYDAPYIIRLTADCPLLDPMVVATLWASYAAYGNDGYMGLAPQWPDGQDCEVFSRAYLQEAHARATAQSDREHVTPFMRRHEEVFESRVLACPFDYQAHQYSVDTAEDLAMVDCIVRGCQQRYGYAFGWREIAAVIEATPEVLALMSQRPPRNHAYHDQVWRESGGTTVHRG